MCWRSFGILIVKRGLTFFLNSAVVGLFVLLWHPSALTGIRGVKDMAFIISQPGKGVEGQPDENVREVHFLSGQTSKENEDFVYSFR